MLKFPDRLTYKKKEIIHLTKLDSRVLEFWEKEFAVLHPVVSQNGEKYYSRQDLELILKIRQWLIVEKKEKKEVRALLSKEGNDSNMEGKGQPGSCLKTRELRRIRDSLQEILTILDENDKK